MTVNTEVRDKFEKDLAEVAWKDLRFHLQKDAIILVAEELDLVDVAVAVAADHKDQVSQWISVGTLTKPSREQIDHWEARLDTPFRMLIAQPYILAQPVAHD